MALGLVEVLALTEDPYQQVAVRERAEVTRAEHAGAVRQHVGDLALRGAQVAAQAAQLGEQ